MKTVLSYGPRLLIWTLFTQTKAALNKFRCSIATLGALSFKSIIHLHTHLRPFKSLPLLCTCHCKHDSSFDSSVEIQQFSSLHHLKNELIYWEKRSHCSNHLLIMWVHFKSIFCCLIVNFNTFGFFISFDQNKSLKDMNSVKPWHAFWTILGHLIWFNPA